MRLLTGRWIIFGWIAWAGVAVGEERLNSQSGGASLLSHIPMMDYDHPSMREAQQPARPAPLAPTRFPTATFTPEIVDWAKRVLNASIDPQYRGYYRLTRRAKDELAQAQMIYDISVKEAADAERLRLQRDLLETVRTNALLKNKIPTSKMRNDLAQAQVVYDTLRQSLKAYREIVAEYGAEVLPTVAKAQMTTLHNSIILQLKQLYGLGVIQQNNELILSTAVNIFNPSDWSNWIASNERIKEQIKLIDAMVVRDLNAKRQSNGLPPLALVDP